MKTASKFEQRLAFERQNGRCACGATATVARRLGESSQATALCPGCAGIGPAPEVKQTKLW